MPARLRPQERSNDSSAEPPYPPPVTRTAFSLLAGRMVPTDSEEWRHECEGAAVLAMSVEGRRRFFDGATEPDGRRERGVTEIRGAAAVEPIKADMVRLEEMRRKG